MNETILKKAALSDAPMVEKQEVTLEDTPAQSATHSIEKPPVEYSKGDIFRMILGAYRAFLPFIGGVLAMMLLAFLLVNHIW